MSVNGFSNEDGVLAAYQAVERCLLHAVDVGEITVTKDAKERRIVISRLAVRIAEAVMHSSEQDITELVPGIVTRVSK